MSYLECGLLDPMDNAELCFEFTGGNDAIVIVKRGESFDTQSQSEVQALIDAGKAVLITGISAGFPAPSPVQVDSNVACEPQTTLTMNRTLDWRHGAVSAENNDAYDSMSRANGFKAGTILMHSCSNGYQYVIEGKIAINGGLVNPMSDEELQEYVYQAAWKSRNNPRIETTSNPIFN
jgi:hypothetical protein